MELIIDISKGNIRINLIAIGKGLLYLGSIPLLVAILWILGLGLNYTLCGMSWDYSIEKTDTAIEPKEGILSTNEYEIHMEPPLFGGCYPHISIDRRVIVVRYAPTDGEKKGEEKSYFIHDDGNWESLGSYCPTMREIRDFEEDQEDNIEIEELRQLRERIDPGE